MKAIECLQNLKEKGKKKKGKIILLNKKACLSKTEKKTKIDYEFE